MYARYFRAAPPDAPQEDRMAASTAVRQLHRWLGIIFTLTVIANFVAMALGTPPAWITYSPLAPLFLLMFSGLYMFFRPYFARGRA
jgi:hypothetical protein